MQLNPNAFNKGLFTVAVKDIIKQPMTLTKRETEDDDSDGGHDDKDDDDDCDGDNASCFCYNLDGSTADGDAVRQSSSSEIFDIHLTLKSKT